jgi:hypothetical protein
MKIPSLITFCTVLVVGGALTAGATNALGQTDEEKTTIADSWQTAKSKIAPFGDTRVNRRQLDAQTTKDVVMLRGKVNSDAAKPAAEDIAKELDGEKNDSKVVTPPLREAVGDSEDSTAKDAKERAAKFHGLHANRLKLKIMNSLFLSLMKP